MDDSQVERFRMRLLTKRAALDAEDALGKGAEGIVQLDQQSVGRLSRMDALQQQAMAKATKGRRAQVRQRIDAALTRIDDGEFGNCVNCGEDIALGRLELDPMVPVCINCASGS